MAVHPAGNPDLGDLPYRCDPGVREGNNTDDVSRNPDNAGRRATWQETTPRIFPPGTCSASLDARRACSKGRAICWKDGGGYHDRGDDRHPDKWNDNLVSAKPPHAKAPPASILHERMAEVLVRQPRRAGLLQHVAPPHHGVDGPHLVVSRLPGFHVRPLRRSADRKPSPVLLFPAYGDVGRAADANPLFLASLTGGILPLSGYYLWWKKRKRK